MEHYFLALLFTLILFSSCEEKTVVTYDEYDEFFKVLDNGCIEKYTISKGNKTKQTFVLIDNNNMPILKEWYNKSKKPFYVIKGDNGIRERSSFDINQLDTSEIMIPEIVTQRMNDSLYSISLVSKFYPTALIDFGYNFTADKIRYGEFYDATYVILNTKQILDNDYILFHFRFRTPDGQYLKQIDSVKVELPSAGKSL